MVKGKQLKLAQDFNKLHHQSKMLLLPNVWDVGSAKIFEKQGFRAIATTSAGIAYSMGYPDGENLTIDDLVFATKNIVQRVSIPLSVDLEKGYGNNAEEVKENVRKIIAAGAVGVNIEDGNSTETPYLDDLSLMTEKISALVELKEEMGIPFVINARTCAFWLQIGEKTSRMNLAIERANAFAGSGADCVFLPGGISKSELIHLLKNIACPVNIIANPLFNDLKEMEKTGVSRLSIGSGAVRAAFGQTLQVAEQLKDYSIDLMLANSLTYDKANKLFED